MAHLSKAAGASNFGMDFLILASRREELESVKAEFLKLSKVPATSPISYALIESLEDKFFDIATRWDTDEAIFTLPQVSSFKQAIRAQFPHGVKAALQRFNPQTDAESKTYASLINSLNRYVDEDLSSLLAAPASSDRGASAHRPNAQETRSTTSAKKKKKRRKKKKGPKAAASVQTEAAIRAHYESKILKLKQVVQGHQAGLAYERDIAAMRRFTALSAGLKQQHQVSWRCEMQLLGKASLQKQVKARGEAIKRIDEAIKELEVKEKQLRDQLTAAKAAKAQESKDSLQTLKDKLEQAKQRLETSSSAVAALKREVEQLENCVLSKERYNESLQAVSQDLAPSGAALTAQLAEEKQRYQLYMQAMRDAIAISQKMPAKLTVALRSTLIYVNKPDVESSVSKSEPVIAFRQRAVGLVNQWRDLSKGLAATLGQIGPT